MTLIFQINHSIHESGGRTQWETFWKVKSGLCEEEQSSEKGRPLCKVPGSIARVRIELM